MIATLTLPKRILVPGSVMRVLTEVCGAEETGSDGNDDRDTRREAKPTALGPKGAGEGTKAGRGAKWQGVKTLIV